RPESATASQILFGDLHVHTTYSGDAFIFSLPLFQGEGVPPPADACDFARFCSGLDFWSINDHAEDITTRQWAETREAVRECNAVTDPENPDLVAFLGWEWTQAALPGGAGGRTHYGHKNVIFRDSADDRVPRRPIGAGDAGLFEQPIPPAAWALLRAGIASRDLGNLQPYLDFNRFAREVRAMEACPKGVPVRDLPGDCLEGAETPAELFAKLDEWGYPSLVIPHGTSWGIHAPPSARLDDQLSQGDHDPDRQRLFEVYSGHGSSEVYREWLDHETDADGMKRCASPRDGYLPCCWQAGELIRGRCTADTPKAVCEQRVEEARQRVVDSTAAPYALVSGTTPDDWLTCGQLDDGFLPAFDYRPHMSAQYGLALRAEDGSTYRYGLIGSSDNHKARPGPGYKEIARKAYGDAYGFRRDWYDALTSPGPPSPESNTEPRVLGALGLGLERGASFYYTSGLVAVHARARDREAIWQALESRNVYGTSGARILLDFSLVNGPAGPEPMGSEVEMQSAPRFEVRASGAFEQLPGCPDFVGERLSPERLRRLCLGECYHPSDLRTPIDRIEIVRIRKQTGPGEKVGELIEDPWRSFECPISREGCRVSFDDPGWESTRETVYYARALQRATPAVNGDPLRCERDESGTCISVRSCPASGPNFEPGDDCLSPVQERAWSSPIFVRGL
ncbi:MAG: DUF3604 domain-containing protein, partial [Myxococcota bacterium]|nr:DUF3604 domain-containing protein [Myxococcota bacterium]